MTFYQIMRLNYLETDEHQNYNEINKFFPFGVHHRASLPTC